MKHKILTSFLLVSAGAFIIAGQGCKRLEDFGTQNNDPNGSAAPITSALISQAETDLGRVVEGTAAGVNGGIYAQYFSETQYTDVSLYSEPKLAYSDALSGDAASTGFYAGPMYDLQTVINMNSGGDKGSQTGSGSNANQIAVATILKSYMAWTITDRWGDIPYSQALLATGNTSPKYDLQSDVYAKLLTDLTTARDGFDGGVDVKGDVIYGGDEAKWKKLANSLCMLISVRMSKVYPNAGQLAATAFAAAANDPNGYITSNADNFTLVYPGGSYKSPWFNLYDGRKDYAFCQTLSDIMGNMNDARRSEFSGAGAPFPYGLVRSDAIDFDGSVSGNWAYVLADDQRAEGSSVVIVNAASVLLAAAEAVERGWMAGDAASLYNAGVTASFEQWGFAGNAAAYLSSAAANYATGTGGGSGIGANAYGSVVGADALTPTKLSRIALQRYLAHYPDGVQGWSEWRRTGVPHLTATTAATNSPGFQIPRRLVYGTSEYSLNPSHVAEAAGRLTGGDKMDSHIWWDQ